MVTKTRKPPARKPVKKKKDRTESFIRGKLTLTHGGKTYRVVDILRQIPGYDPFRDADGFYFDTEAAQLYLDFCEECLQFVEGGNVAGKPFILEAWQVAVTANIFGWKDITTSFRRYKEVFLYVPRKNGKTPLAATIVLFMLFVDDEAGAQIYSAASDREQAALVYRHAKAMIEIEPEMMKRCKVLRSQKLIERIGRLALYRALSSDAETKHGLNASTIITDELHSHKKPDLVETLETSQASREQPLLVHTTTADYNRPSICNKKYQYAVMVRDGVEGARDAAFLPVIYEAKLDDAHDDPEVWQKSNPNLGVSVTLAYLKREASKATLDPTKLNTFRRLHLNIRTESAERLFNMEHWKHQQWKNDPRETAIRWRARMLRKLVGKRAYGGLDISSTNDITAFVLWFPEEKVVLPWFWVPGQSMELRQRQDAVPYLTWSQQGFIEKTDGTYIDQEHINTKILELANKYHIAKLGFDKWGAQYMYVSLAKAGINCLRYGQGYGEMTGPVRRVTAMLGRQEFNHGGNPVLEWMFRNASGTYKDAKIGQEVTEQMKDGLVRPDKKSSGEKIDGVMGTLMAIGVADADEDASVYETEGIKQLDAPPDALGEDEWNEDD